MNKIVLSLGLLSSILLAQGNGNGFDLDDYSTSSLTLKLKNAIAYMGNEERLAYDIYQNLYNYHSDENGIEINQLEKISEKSERRHIEIVKDLVDRYELSSDELTNVSSPIADSSIDIDDMPSGEYDIPSIQKLYNDLYNKGIDSKRDALEVGCMVEVTDINDLNYYIGLAEESNADDVEEAFNVLKDGSYRHYWAFDRGLKNMGIEDGCCSLGTINHVNYCQPDYPNSKGKNEHGNGNEHRNGHGNGHENGHGHGHGND